jgi:hypothetical protein
MSVANRWYDEEKRIILTEVGQTFSVEELLEAIDQGLEMLAAVDHRVDFIMDFAGNERWPDRMLSHYPQIARKTDHPRNGETVMVGLNSQTRVLAEVFSKVFRKMHYAETVEAAAEILRAKHQA